MIKRMFKRKKEIKEGKRSKERKNEGSFKRKIDLKKEKKRKI